jgi:NADH:ubiquinone oxidoreductase subunit 6 (subunit J)
VNLTVMIILLVGLVLSALFTVLIRDLLKGAIALAVMSAVLTIILFLLNAPLAAVFELSVCAGLVTVVFISAISMTKLRTKEEVAQHRQERRRRFLALPVILIALAAIALAVIWPHANDLLANVGSVAGAKAGADVFWKERQVDLLGQIVIILAGVFGVLIFFKERGGE